MADGTTIDRERSKEFMMRMMDMLNGGAIVHMVSLGNRTGLFDAMSGLEPSTSAQIATVAGLNERYVREWLGAMVTGGIVEHDGDKGTYLLPAEHAAALTTAAGPRNLSTMAKMLASMTQVEPEVADCFRNGGGVAYDQFPEFHQLQREASGAVQDATLVKVVIPLVEGIPEKLEGGIEVADVGCGAGHAVNLMAQAFPNSQFHGFDFSEEAVEMGRIEARSMGLSNAVFQALDVAQLDEPGRFDFITTFDAIHDQARPEVVVAAISSALKDDGTWLCVDIAGSSHVHNNLDHPMGPFFYTMSTMHCMTVSLAYDGEGLGAMWGEERAREIFTDSGFSDIEVRRVPGDSVNNYYICTK
jgi:2-polyprenyl-3-methyl-5-hydroxy-6-metoxy-1,4-benzoquinol methylase